jgi:regulator of replication initiation timing
MITRTVTSPAGEEIELLSDRAFVELAGGDISQQHIVTLMVKTTDFPVRWAYIRALWNEGAAVDERHGRATLLLMERALRYGLPPDSNKTSITHQTGPAATGSFSAAVERTEKSLRRTSRLALVRLPERWYAELLSETAQTERVEIEPELIEEQTTAAPALQSSSVVEIELANAVATALLAQVVEIVSTKGVDGINGARELSQLQLDYAALSERLGTQVSYVEKLRRELRELGDEVHALKVERDGLRRELRATQHNLQVATSKDSQRIIQAEVDRQVAQLMRETPNGANSRVAAHDAAVAS